MIFTTQNIIIGIMIIVFVGFLAELIYFIYVKRKNSAIKRKKICEEAEKIITQRGYDYSYSDEYAYDIGGATHQGMREYQEDSYHVPDDKTLSTRSSQIVIMCDGMGGMECGGEASGRTVKTLADNFYSQEELSNVPEFFGSQVDLLDADVLNIKNARGEIANAGTTLISAIIKDNKFHWMSIGDSRIYLYRDNELVQLTRDHNYLLELLAKAEQGLITKEQAYNDPQSNALISFVGMNGIELADISAESIELLENDILILCSDGLYNSLSNSEMLDIISTTDSMKLLSHRLVIEAFDKGFIHQDNTTVIAVKRK